MRCCTSASLFLPPGSVCCPCLPARRQDPVTAEHVFQWRNMMEFFLIKHFRRCLPLLLKYDAVGASAALLGNFSKFSNPMRSPSSTSGAAYVLVHTLQALGPIRSLTSAAISERLPVPANDQGADKSTNPLRCMPCESRRLHSEGCSDPLRCLGMLK